MSQPAKQQTLSYKFTPNAKLETAHARLRPQAGFAGPGVALARPQGRRQTRQQSRRPAFLILGLAVSLPVLAVLYISAHALTVGVEYQRQRLAEQVNMLRARNLDLRCTLSRAADLNRVSQFAAAAGMQPAEPAAESDFFSLSPSQLESQAQRPAWFSQGPMLVAGIAHQFNLAIASDRAEASTLFPESPRPGRSD